MKKPTASILGIALFLNLGGCGEPITSTPPASSAEGLWSGNTNTNRTLTSAVLDNGTYYLFYSAVANPNAIAGVIQGTGTSNNGTFSSTDTKDFGIGSSARMRPSLPVMGPANS